MSIEGWKMTIYPTIKLTTSDLIHSLAVKHNKTMNEIAADVLDSWMDSYIERVEGKPIQINWTGYIFAFFVGAVVGAIAAYLNLLWG